MFRRDKGSTAPTPVVPPRPSKEDLDHPVMHSQDTPDAGQAFQRPGVLGVMQKVNPFRSTSQTPTAVSEATSSESVEQRADSTQNPGMLKGVMQKVNPFKSTSQVPKVPSSESLEQGRVSDSNQNPGMLRGVMQKVNPFKPSTQVPKSDPQNDSADPPETGQEPQAKQNPGMIAGMMQKVNPFKSSQPKDPRPLHSDLSSSNGSLADNNNLPQKQNPGMLKGMMQKVNPFRSSTQVSGEECQTDSVVPDTTSFLKTQEDKGLESEHSTSSESLDDSTIERHSVWYVNADEVKSPSVQAPKKRTMTFRIKRILPSALFGSGTKDSAAPSSDTPQERVEVQTLEMAEVPLPSEGTVQDPLDDEEGLLSWWRTVEAYPLPNVALRGVATQASTLSFASADKAIDGRRNSFYSHGFCSHTAENETNPWWRVDLLAVYTVISVKVTNRGDCCAERLDGAEIRIGNSLVNNGNNNPRCASISHISAGKTYTFRCDGGSLNGRFVNVVIPGERKTLTLCEVEVYATPPVAPLPNVALKKQAIQSSTGSEPNVRDASNAVSGCKSAIFSDGCCSHTLSESNPWWSVDLSAVHRVRAVTIINRQDCCSERLMGAEIWIGNSYETYNDSYRCGSVSQVQATPIHTFRCGDISGQYVFVTIPGHLKMLSLCEVEVYAFPQVPEVAPSSRLLLLPPPPPPLPPPPPTVSMQLSGRDVTVVGRRLCWSDALFFCRRHHWDLLSLHSQEEQSEMERLLSRSPFPLTDYVWLGLRRNLFGRQKMLNSWFWMSGDSMNFTKWPQGSAARPSSNLCGGVARGERHLWEDQPCDELLNFICQSRAEDTGQRVYFYSTREVLSTS